jgi:effector-binding domain-containing protein
MKKTISVLALLLFLSAASASPITGKAERTLEAKTISLKEVAAFSYCCIPHKGPFTEIENIIMKLTHAIQEQKVTPAGMMIGIYYNSPEVVKFEDLEWEIGFPVAARVSVQKPLEKKQWEHTLVVSAVHTGPYEQTGQTILKMMEWMQDNKLVQSGPVLERYLTMPGPDTRPEDLRSQLWIPCRKK